MVNRWENRGVVIAGGSAGLGLHLALTAIQAGARVALIGRNEQKLEDARNVLLQQNKGAVVQTVVANVIERQAASRAAQLLTESFGGIDVVINAIGKSDRGSVLQLDGDHMRDLFEANVLTGLNLIQQFTPALGVNGLRSLVLIGSLSSLFAPRFLGGYSIAKHGLAALAQQARLELASQSVHVLHVCPGPIKRSDAGQRYSHLSQSDELPKAAFEPAAGAKVSGLDATTLAHEILAAILRRDIELIRPRRARCLFALQALAPKFGEAVLRRFTS